MMNKFIEFLVSEDGAVTVDWVVLTAAGAAVGLAVMGAVSRGLDDLSGDIETQLTSQGITIPF